MWKREIVNVIICITPYKAMYLRLCQKIFKASSKCLKQLWLLDVYTILLITRRKWEKEGDKIKVYDKKLWIFWPCVRQLNNCDELYILNKMFYDCTCRQNTWTSASLFVYFNLFFRYIWLYFNWLCPYIILKWIGLIFIILGGLDIWNIFFILLFNILIILKLLTT